MFDPAHPRVPQDAPVPALGMTHRTADGGVHVLAVEGEIDLASAGELEGALDTLASLRDATGFVLELSGVRHCDSTGLRLLVGFHKRLGAARTVTFAAVPEPVAVVLRVAGLDRVFSAFATVDEAVAAARRAAGGSARAA